ncbi:MAG: formate/nitrite transporter family protein [Pirellulaceae bacterium]|nr:formate/nitrite transporter family protein [Pirellulaceae bacterium]
MNDPHVTTSTHSPDALLPLEMAHRAEQIGQDKVERDAISLFVLAVLAGAFIAWGGVFYTVVTTSGINSLPFGFTKFLGGLAFSLGLILVIVGGAELFTGNNLIVMALANGRIKTRQLLRNWALVYAGNFVGAVGVAILVFMAGVPNQAEGQVGEAMHSIAIAKCSLVWPQAIAAGIGCNLLVCLAIWLCFSARSVADKVLAIIFPITAFVATGMEHCVANMYFIPMGMLVQFSTHENTDRPISLMNFFGNNLLPVTIGNIIGGTVLVGMVYWFVYLRPERNKAESDQAI